MDGKFIRGIHGMVKSITDDIKYCEVFEGYTQLHSHLNTEVYFAISGTGVILENGLLTSIRDGGIFVTSPGLSHAPRQARNLKLLVINGREEEIGVAE